ncbi:hypothetical protein [Pseudomonas sp. 5P_5.1_Bac1]|uniref:hypothetical protein n=1 Tax=Pseudomonas sp. 5P_5.1_Bac1 TaxID=2971616 RepID=UPI0021C93E1B|nr:hypothetical protein [Pseudomonas sp. 5P_5.1_Bac1]MCU1724241.1 hypothetical protein [Pseudomonas sp. 5P_5.1_Bac1]
MAEEDAQYSKKVYDGLLQNPLSVLKQASIEVNSLDPAGSPMVRTLAFAAAGTNIVIDKSPMIASGMLKIEIDGAIERPMIVSPMRGHGLPVGNGVGDRHQAAEVFDATVGEEQLWVTELQTGCTTLMLDWGRSRYSLVHLQPSEDAQFNRASQAIMWVGNKTTYAYKNTWLKQEMTTVVNNTTTTKSTPQRYIMVQSMFESSRKHSTQVIGIRRKTEFDFYRQRRVDNKNVVEKLTWSTWRSYLPYFSY